MEQTSRSMHDSVVKRYALIAALAWTLIVLCSLLWNLYSNIENSKQLATQEARALFNKDKAFRFWGASHGGVYVPVTKETPPNPFLTHVQERDITTPSGRELTLMNPAYMVREMMEVYDKVYGVKGHITSTIHFRPETAPDEWEKKALKRFENGEKEVVEFSKIEDKPYLRLMQPLYADKSCLKCHAFQGYKEGDLRGGVSLSLPIESYMNAQKNHTIRVLSSHLVFWLIGLIAIYIFSKKLTHAIVAQKLSEEQRQESEHYLHHVLDSQPNIVVVNDGQHLIDTNRAFFKFFTQFKDLASFKEKHKCICDFFESVDSPEYLIQNKDGKSWLELLMERPNAYYRVKITQEGQVYHFAVNLEHLILSDKQIRNIITLTDISELIKNKENLKQRVEEELTKRSTLEEKMLEQSRLAQMGELVTMISHHWRQPLNIVGLVMQNLKDDFESGRLKPETLHESEDTIMKTIKKLSGTLQTLSTYMGKKQRKRAFDASQAIHDLSDIIKAELEAEYFEVEVACEEGITLLGVPTYFGEIFQNLIKNAQESAIQNSRDNRKMEIAFWSREHKAILSISDNGPGVDEKAVQRIFEPFFTTKSAATKTGLGLYTVKMLMEQHFNGTVELSSSSEKTTFTLTFPIEETKEEIL